MLSLANFGARMPATSDSSGYLIPATTIQHLSLGTWLNQVDTTKYQAGIFGAPDGVAGAISHYISDQTKYFDTTASRSQGWHHARILVGPADLATHVANVLFFVDDMTYPAFSRPLPAGNVGFNSLHFNGSTVYPPALSESAGYFDAVTFQAVNDPYIVQQPASVSTNYGSRVTFSVVAMATSYQWKKNGGVIGGATGSALALNSVSALDAGTYTCVVGGANGPLNSDPATLSVSGSPPVLNAALVGSSVVITWQGSNPLLSATNVSGPYLPVAGATSPYTVNPPLGARRFFGLGQ
jgi:hypothetical protein